MSRLTNSRSSFAAVFKKLWGNPEAQRSDIDAGETILLHRKVVERNRLLREVYLRWYRECLPAYRETAQLSGDMLEIGCGGGILETVLPGVIKTDVVPNPYAHRVMDGMKLDSPDNSLRAIFAIGVVHHMTEPSKFFAEAQRCLKTDGRLVLIEPNNSPVQRVICKLLEHYEFFDDTISEWTNGSANRMSNANLALSWVIFVRDRALFHQRFPSLRVKRLRYHTFLAYMISGGMAYRPFAPAAAAPLVNMSEVLLKPLMSKLGTSMTIDVVKR